MSTRSIMAGRIAGKFNRRSGAAAAAVLLVGAGLAFGAFKVFEDSPNNGVPSLGDGTRFLFVASRSAPQVTVIDSKSDQAVTRIKVADIPHQVLVSDAAGAMVVSFASQSAVELVDLSPAARGVKIDLTVTPDFMVLSPDGYLIAAADSSRGSVAVASLQQRKRLFSLSGFGDPRNLTFSLDGSQLYITDRKTLELAVVDIVQESVIDRVALIGEVAPNTNRQPGDEKNGGVSALTRTPDGRYGFVSFANLDSLVVVDLSTLKPVKRLRVGRAPLRPYGTADGRLMLVPNEGDRTVSIVDTATLEVIATLPGAKDVTAINTGWFESTAFVMSPDRKRVVVLDLMKFSKLDDIELPGSPGSGVVTSNGQKLYAPLGDTDQVAVIDTHTHKLAALIGGVGRQPGDTIMARSNNYCH